MDPYEVGLFRRCPACGRPVVGEAEAATMDARDNGRLDDIECSCCERPWIACPCTPVEEGDCRSVRPS